jgi:cytochrome c peroxidase
MLSCNKWFLGVLMLVCLNLLTCEDDPLPTDCGTCGEEAIAGTYAPTMASINMPAFLGIPVIPDDNPQTEQGVKLGRMLFFDPILSIDSSMSCASCHLPELSFTDGRAASVGVLGLTTKRSSMAIVNLSLLNGNLFWDGSANSLEAQALLPIEAHDELNDTWENVALKLQRHAEYPRRFREAFGIEFPSEIKRELAVKAIAQFERTLISANSKYDQVVWKNEGEFTEEEELGYELFKVETSQVFGHPGCTHCHTEPNLTDNQFHNNGLDDVSSFTDFTDLGRGGFNNVVFDNGKFRTPTLRNIALSAPYMHDGRFQTLEEVLDHYAAGGHGFENEDANIRPFNLTDEEKQALVAFLNTLTDTSFIGNPAFQSPF